MDAVADLRFSSHQSANSSVISISHLFRRNFALLDLFVYFFFRDNMLLSYSHSLSLLKVQNLTKILH